VIARALAVGIICAPFISALLLGLHRAGRALHTRLTRRRPAVTFHYTDPDGDEFTVAAGTRKDGTPVVYLHAEKPVHIPLDRLEEIVAGLRDTGRQAAGGAP
jgi:hypothetical protein